MFTSLRPFSHPSLRQSRLNRPKRLSSNTDMLKRAVQDTYGYIEDASNVKGLVNAFVLPHFGSELEFLNNECHVTPLDHMSIAKGIVGVWLLTGNARSTAENAEKKIVPWSSVLKAYNNTTHHEYRLYRTGFLEKIHTDLNAAPQIYEMIPAVRGDGYWILTEALTDMYREKERSWDVDAYLASSYCAGMISGYGEIMGKNDAIEHRQSQFSTKDRYALYKTQLFCLDEEVNSDIKHMFPVHIRDSVKDYAERELKKIETSLDTIPLGLSHGDFNPLNLFCQKENEGNIKVRAVDWEYAGLEPLGYDLYKLLQFAGMYTLRDNSLTQEEFITKAIKQYAAGYRAVSGKEINEDEIFLWFVKESVMAMPLLVQIWMKSFKYMDQTFDQINQSNESKSKSTYQWNNAIIRLYEKLNK